MFNYNVRGLKVSANKVPLPVASYGKISANEVDLEDINFDEYFVIDEDFRLVYSIKAPLTKELAYNILRNAKTATFREKTDKKGNFVELPLLNRLELYVDDNSFRIYAYWNHNLQEVKRLVDNWKSADSKTRQRALRNLKRFKRYILFKLLFNNYNPLADTIVIPAGAKFPYIQEIQFLVPVEEVQTSPKASRSYKLADIDILHNKGMFAKDVFDKLPKSYKELPIGPITITPEIAKVYIDIIKSILSRKIHLADNKQAVIADEIAALVFKMVLFETWVSNKLADLLIPDQDRVEADINDTLDLIWLNEYYVEELLQTLKDAGYEVRAIMEPQWLRFGEYFSRIRTYPLAVKKYFAYKAVDYLFRSLNEYVKSGLQPEIARMGLKPNELNRYVYWKLLYPAAIDIEFIIRTFKHIYNPITDKKEQVLTDDDIRTIRNAFSSFIQSKLEELNADLHLGMPDVEAEDIVAMPRLYSSRHVATYLARALNWDRASIKFKRFMLRELFLNNDEYIGLFMLGLTLNGTSVMQTFADIFAADIGLMDENGITVINLSELAKNRDCRLKIRRTITPIKSKLTKLYGLADNTLKGLLLYLVKYAIGLGQCEEDTKAAEDKFRREYVEEEDFGELHERYLNEILPEGDSINSIREWLISCYKLAIDKHLKPNCLKESSDDNNSNQTKTEIDDNSNTCASDNEILQADTQELNFVQPFRRIKTLADYCEASKQTMQTIKEQIEYSYEVEKLIEKNQWKPDAIAPSLFSKIDFDHPLLDKDLSALLLAKLVYTVKNHKTFLYDAEYKISAAFYDRPAPSVVLSGAFFELLDMLNHLRAVQTALDKTASPVLAGAKEGASNLIVAYKQPYGKDSDVYKRLVELANKSGLLSYATCDYASEHIDPLKLDRDCPLRYIFEILASEDTINNIFSAGEILHINVSEFYQNKPLVLKLYLQAIAELALINGIILSALKQHKKAMVMIKKVFGELIANDTEETINRYLAGEIDLTDEQYNNLLADLRKRHKFALGYYYMLADRFFNFSQAINGKDYRRRIRALEYYSKRFVYAQNIFRKLQVLYRYNSKRFVTHLCFVHYNGSKEPIDLVKVYQQAAQEQLAKVYEQRKKEIRELKITREAYNRVNQMKEEIVAIEKMEEQIRTDLLFKILVEDGDTRTNKRRTDLESLRKRNIDLQVEANTLNSLFSLFQSFNSPSI